VTRQPNHVASLVFFTCLYSFFANLAGPEATAAETRPPSVPLVACDPYFSIWSSADKLTDADTVHWTGKPHRLWSDIQIDGKVFRVMGTQPDDAPPFPQTSVSVQPTRTIYTFAGSGIQLTLTFMTPALPDDLDILSRPVTYVTWELRATDGKEHRVGFRFSASGELAVNTPDQQVEAHRLQMDGLEGVRIGSIDQPILAKRGDDIRIDWGYLYLAAPAAVADARAFIITAANGSGKGDETTAAIRFNTERVGAKSVKRWLMLAYDDLYSIQFMKQNLRPYWRRGGWTAEDLLKASCIEYELLTERCIAFDKELMADLATAGGSDYAYIGALAYRQCFAAGKFVADGNGQPIQFCKENHSNGCIGTSDVFYPMSPQFLLFGPSLAKSFIVPFMEYAASDRWKFPFAPHDLGQYPHANGQRYGGGERSEENQMPVEESGNLLILFAAVAEMEGNADFASRYWPQLEQWAEYLKDKGFDPENQLCTDDFAGHLAHNVNLSAKAICGLASFAKLCRLRGESQRATEFEQLAESFAQQWVAEARDDDRFRLAFDRPGTWSQKYNLVWDRVLGLNLFPEEVKRKEMDHYLKVQNKYGLPLDNRATYTKLDWILWTATLTQDSDDFSALVRPVARFLNETPDRVPMTDWYFTDTGKRRGFTARPVVGGVFMQMLYNKDVWHKYSQREKTHASDWAPMPTPPKTVPFLPTSEQDGVSWRYTTEQPQGDWQDADYDDSSWHEGMAGFGTSGTPGAVVRTEWNSNDIWIRREVELSKVPEKVAIRMHHDEDTEVFINGQPVLRRRGFTTDYDSIIIAQHSLRKGKNVLAAHCHQTNGGQYIDLGIEEVIEE
jgi:hypothetical protein